eukprot:TRINITY_DN97267_c0_g1_i1.p1 TRINITY_DN97267_c0_g1~~TRINITY_DN97267_c0_g1_i1.p1  ORF type:complete len:527 (+),score=141.00 TRINITY_DN97267_c0_g1_i1:95-1675(+)
MATAGGYKADADDVPRDLEGSFIANKEWQYPLEQRSSWLPANAQELVDSHPWTRRAVEKNPRFPGIVPPEALFCWSEPDFASYINSGGFVKPKLQCQYYISPENPQSIVDLLEPILSDMNWTCTVDSKVGRDDTLAQVTDYMGMPVPRLKKQQDGTLEVVKPKEEVAPIFIWEASRNMVDHKPTLKHRGLCNRLSGVSMFTKVGMLELIRERCIERDIPINFPPPWYPLTFTLPDDLEQWKRHAEANPHKKWIYKPNGEAMGRGIILVNKITDVDSKEKPFRTRCKNVEVFDPKEPPLKERDFASYGVIQEYMVNPLLLENRKFAVRVYMLVARTKPYLTFHYNFGYIKRCGEFYDENKFNREDLFRHITNQEFQKKQDDFTTTAAAEIMSIEALDKYLQENYGIPAFRLNFWQQVKAICMEVCLGMKEAINEECKVGQFEIFGLDVIVDGDQRVYMLEANRDPSWVMDTKVKKEIIPDMIREMLEIVFWAHSDDGKGKEAMLHSPMRGWEVLIDEQFDFQAVDVD